MKYLLPILLLFSVNCMAQTDSTALKLKKYKELYEQGLIDSAEYKQLKAQLISPDTKPPKDLEQLRISGKDNMIVGGVFTGVGGAQIIGGFIYRELGLSRYTTVNAGALSAYKRNQGLLFGCGAVFSVIGVGFLVSGHIKTQNAKALSALRIKPDGLCYMF